MKMFPVMIDPKKHPDCPAEVPYALVTEHEKQAKANHCQTVKRLAERGGLAPCELLAVLEDRPWHKMDHQEAVEGLKAIAEDVKICAGCGLVIHDGCGEVDELPDGTLVRFCRECVRGVE